MDGIPANHNPVLQDVLDLRPYINSSAAAIQESFSLDRTYVVFRTLGLRHLVVVDRHNHVKGIVTRKVQTLLSHALHKCTRHEERCKLPRLSTHWVCWSVHIRENMIQYNDTTHSAGSSHYAKLCRHLLPCLAAGLAGFQA